MVAVVAMDGSWHNRRLMRNMAWVTLLVSPPARILQRRSIPGWHPGGYAEQPHPLRTQGVGGIQRLAGNRVCTLVKGFVILE